MKENTALRKKILAALFLAIGLILPFITMQIPAVGKMLCPMHIPVLLCGYICGWPYGLLIGIITPLLRGVLFGMPAIFPNAFCMAFELATYGLVAGILSEKMKKDIGDHLISKLDLQDIAKVLSDELSGSELNTVLLDIFNKRVQQETPSSLLSKYEGNKLVKPALLEDVLEYKEKELRCYKLIAGRGFEPIELSPVAQFGTSSVIATVDQKKVLTSLRNTEVQADPTNAIALHYASLKKKGELDNKTYNYSNISRVIRTQVFNNPNFTPHFTVLALISCGRDTGSFNFEKEELLKHLTTSYEICKSYGVEKIYYEIIPCKGYDSQSPLIMESISYVREKNSNLEVLVIAPEHDNNYYHGFRIKQQIVIGGNTIEIADGGLLDWTQQLLTNKKERMMTFGLGIQVLYHLTK